MRTWWALAGAVLAIVAVSALVMAGPSPPGLKLISPRSGAVVSGEVSVVADAPEDLDCSFLLFGVDDDRPAAMNARPFRWAWDTTTWPDGPHVLLVEAHGPRGVVATAGPVRVTVRNHAPAPAPLAPPSPAPRPMVPALLPPPGQPHAPAPGTPRVSLEGQTLDATVSLRGGEARLPVRPVISALDGSIAWDPRTHAVSAWCGDRVVMLVVGHPVATVNGAPLRLHGAPAVERSRVVLSARGLAQVFDLTVSWDAAQRTLRLAPIPRRPATTTRTADARP